MAHISIRGLSIDFTVFGADARSLKGAIVSRATGGRIMPTASSRVAVRAIDKLDLEIADGDRVGLIGHNGAGKTTLLRVIAGIYRPASGSVRIEGRVGALLDPNAGMDLDATGIENIFLRGYVLGMTRREIEAKLPDIAQFTDLGDFLSLPIKTYSAGMTARLAFAISTAAQSDILLIDEGIGAGDAAFQEKAQRRIENFIARTPIVLLASHSDALIKQYCNRRVSLAHGRVLSDELLEPDGAGINTRLV